MIIKQNRPVPAGAKTVCVIRYGAWGDAVLLSPVFRQLKKEGYYVFFNCTEKGYEVQRHNPNIDCFMLQFTDEIPKEQLFEYWKKMEGAFNRIVNLSGSIEMNLVIAPFQKEYILSTKERHEKCNRNYMDETMLKAGYPDLKGQIPEIFYKAKEERWADAVRKKYKGFLVVYGLSGSSVNKTYPYADSVVQAIVEGIPEATVILVGEKGCKGIIDQHPRVLDWCGDFGIRRSFILTKIADLVISTDTSIANAVGCYETPKIILLSQSSPENLTKYYKNCHNIEPNVPCYPCHQLHFTRESCPLEEETKFPVCVALLHPKLILEKVELVYEEWRKAHPEFSSSLNNPV